MDIKMIHLGRDVTIKPNVISPEKCQVLIELFESDLDLIKYNSNETGYASEVTQYSDVSLITESAPNLKKYIYALIGNALSEYKNLLKIPFDLGCQFEPPEIMKFTCDQDQFSMHFDGNGTDHPRTLALIWYLNDVGEGGELHIPSKYEYIKVQPKQGQLAIIPCDWTHYHHVTKPISNDRYSLITFIRY